MSSELTLEHSLMQRISNISKEGAVAPTAPPLPMYVPGLDSDSRKRGTSLQLWCCVKCIKLSMMSKSCEKQLYQNQHEY